MIGKFLNNRWLVFVAVFAVMASFGAVVFGWQRLLQDEGAYRVAEKVMVSIGLRNYPSPEVSNRKTSDRYARPNNENLLAADAGHYHYMCRNMYALDDRDGHYRYAFFPMFPLMWRWLGCNTVGISVINWLLFCIGVAIVVSLCVRRESPWVVLLPLCLPMLTPYMVPLSESLFFLAVAIGMAGVVRNRYWLFFVGFFLAGLTRAAVSVLLVAWVVADIIAALNNRESVAGALRRIVLHALPIVVATFCVMLFQRMNGAEHWFEFVHAQSYWDKSLSWPTLHWTDWSDEGRSISWPLMYAFGMPAVIYLAYMLCRCFRRNTAPTPSLDNRDVLRLLSLLFVVGNILLAMVTQNGCMYSQARLLTCTPFSLFLVLDLASRPLHRWRGWVLGLFGILAVALCWQMYSYGYMQGITVLTLLALLVFLGSRMPRGLRWTMIGLAAVVNILWQGYLLTAYVDGRWLFV